MTESGESAARRPGGGRTTRNPARPSVSASSWSRACSSRAGAGPSSLGAGWVVLIVLSVLLGLYLCGFVFVLVLFRCGKADFGMDFDDYDFAANGPPFIG